MFVPGNPFQPSLILAPHANGLPYSGTPERMTRLAKDEQHSLFSVSLSATKKFFFITLVPGINVIKPFSFIIVDEAK
jgi:hypothetical protein